MPNSSPFCIRGASFRRLGRTYLSSIVSLRRMNKTEADIMTTFRPNFTGAGCATLPRCSAEGKKRKPLQVLIAGTAVITDRLAEQAGRHGWCLHTVGRIENVRRVIYSERASVLVLPADFGGESGFLMCAKLTACFPKLKV